MQSVYKIYYAYQDNQMSKLLELEYSTLSEMFKDIEVVVKKCLKEINKGKPPQNHAITAQDLHYTTALYSQGEKSDPLFFNTLVFDLDAIDVARTDEYVRAFADLTGISPNSIGIISSGGGLHFWLELSTPIKCNDKNFYQQYKTLCSNLDKGLAALGLIHVLNDVNKKKKTNFDAHCFDRNKTLRLPGTINPKYDPPRPCAIVNFASSVVDFTSFCDQVSEKLTKLCTEKGIVAVRPSLGEVDGFAVKQGCKFLQHYSTHQAEQTFDIWHALGLIYLNLGSVDKEADINDFYEASCDYPTFSEQDFQRKVQSIEASGHSSYGCEKINAMWGGCAQCPHFGKVNSPLQIQGENFIASEKDGFWKQVGTEAKPKYVPDYAGLLKKFNSLVTCKYNKQEGIFAERLDDQGLWKITYDSSLGRFGDILRTFAQSHLKIPYNKGEINKEKESFVRYVFDNGINITPKEIEETRLMEHCLNFENGIFNIFTGEKIGDFKTHIVTKKLPYKFDLNAKVPEIFLSAVDTWFQGNQDLIDQLGYVYAHVFDLKYRHHNFHYWFGQGGTGKSTAGDVLKALVGNFSVVKLKHLDIVTMVHPLVDSLVNIVNEFSPESLNADSLNALKELSAGGDLDHRKLFKDPTKTRNICKFLVISNDPFTIKTNDLAITRRIRILPFLKVFTKMDGDFRIELLKPENLTGIMNWVIPYAKKLAELKDFPNPELCAKYTEKFQDDVNPVNIFVNNYLLSPKDLNGSIEKLRITRPLMSKAFNVMCSDILNLKFSPYKRPEQMFEAIVKLFAAKAGFTPTITKYAGSFCFKGILFDIDAFMNDLEGCLIKNKDDMQFFKDHRIKEAEQFNQMVVHTKEYAIDPSRFSGERFEDSNFN